MRWEQISDNEGKEVYELRHNEQCVLTLTDNVIAGTVRIESASEKRTFVIGKEGFFNNRTVLRNEYGIRIGELGIENNEHFIEMENEKFHYTINDSSPVEFIIYKESKENPIITCKLNTPFPAHEPMLVKGKKLLFTKLNYASLLMSMCWYILPPIAKMNRLEYSI
ncbi:MAG: hypothetical protein JWM28_4055 [Chitinophagaceae bacterium]|nr:hypothetical protein [Chitinophagaceae bacterium]